MNFKSLSVQIPCYVFDEVVAFSNCCPEGYDLDDAVLALLIAGLLRFMVEESD